MASKDQIYINDKTSSKQKSPEAATKNPDKLDQRQPSRNALQLQRMVGNQATRRALAPKVHRQPAVYPRVMKDESKTGQDKMQGDKTQGEVVRWCEPETATLEPGEVNQWGEMDGPLTSDVAPHVFVNGGKTGSGVVQWVAGGNGGQGNQNVGDITLVAPEYQTEEASATDPAHKTAWAWIKPGTGKATVTRSYRGVLVGANTTTYYFTAKAAARADVHEGLHVASSRTTHNTHIIPLEQRIAKYTGKAKALKQGADKAAAIAALQAIIKWNETIKAFRDADTAANTPMGTVDTADLASPTFIKDYGPRKVGDVNYDHYMDTPPGP